MLRSIAVSVKALATRSVGCFVECWRWIEQNHLVGLCFNPCTSLDHNLWRKHYSGLCRTFGSETGLLATPPPFHKTLSQMMDHLFSGLPWCEQFAGPNCLQKSGLGPFLWPCSSSVIHWFDRHSLGYQLIEVRFWRIQLVVIKYMILFWISVWIVCCWLFCGLFTCTSLGTPTKRTSTIRRISWNGRKENWAIHMFTRAHIKMTFIYLLTLNLIHHIGPGPPVF